MPSCHRLRHTRGLPTLFWSRWIGQPKGGRSPRPPPSSCHVLGTSYRRPSSPVPQKLPPPATYASVLVGVVAVAFAPLAQVAQPMQHGIAVAKGAGPCLGWLGWLARRAGLGSFLQRQRERDDVAKYLPTYSLLTRRLDSCEYLANLSRPLLCRVRVDGTHLCARGRCFVHLVLLVCTRSSAAQRRSALEGADALCCSVPC